MKKIKFFFYDFALLETLFCDIFSIVLENRQYFGYIYRKFFYGFITKFIIEVKTDTSGNVNNYILFFTFFLSKITYERECPRKILYTRDITHKEFHFVTLLTLHFFTVVFNLCNYRRFWRLRSSCSGEMKDASRLRVATTVLLLSRSNTPTNVRRPEVRFCSAFRWRITRSFGRSRLRLALSKGKHALVQC